MGDVVAPVVHARLVDLREGGHSRTYIRRRERDLCNGTSRCRRGDAPRSHFSPWLRKGARESAPRSPESSRTTARTPVEIHHVPSSDEEPARISRARPSLQDIADTEARRRRQSAPPRRLLGLRILLLGFQDRRKLLLEDLRRDAALLEDPANELGVPGVADPWHGGGEDGEEGVVGKLVGKTMRLERGTRSSTRLQA